jgi:hypothetical protein
LLVGIVIGALIGGGGAFAASRYVITNVNQIDNGCTGPGQTGTLTLQFDAVALL